MICFVAICSGVVMGDFLKTTAKAVTTTAAKTDTSSCKKDSKGMYTCSLDNPLEGNVTDVKKIISMALKGVLGFVGAITLVMFVVGGFTWLVSAGKEEKIKSGRDTMVWAAIGLVAVFASYSVLNYVMNFIVKGSG